MGGDRVSAGPFDRDPQAGDAAVPGLDGGVVVGVAGAFAAGSDHGGALVAQVTDGVGVGEELVETDRAEGGPVVGAARHGFGDRDELAVQVGQDLDVDARGVAFVRVVGFVGGVVGAAVPDRHDRAVHEHHPSAQHFQ